MSLILAAIPVVLKGLAMTLKVTAASALLGLLFGTLIGVGRTVGPKWISWPLAVGIEIIRGTPLYTQLLLGVFGLPQLLDRPIDEFTAGVLIIGLNSSAYVAEIFRGGIQSIDKGQMEAGRSLGLTYAQTMRHIVLPQAVKRALPPLANEFVTLIKESSVVSILGIQEITFKGRIVGTSTYAPFEPMLVVTACYLVLTGVTSQLVKLLERRLGSSDSH